MTKYILFFVEVFGIVLFTTSVVVACYFWFNKTDYKACNSDPVAVHYYNNLPSNPQLKVNRRWV